MKGLVLIATHIKKESRKTIEKSRFCVHVKSLYNFSIYAKMKNKYFRTKYEKVLTYDMESKIRLEKSQNSSKIGQKQLFFALFDHFLATFLHVKSMSNPCQKSKMSNLFDVLQIFSQISFKISSKKVVLTRF